MPINNCRNCQSKKLINILDFGKQPLANRFLKTDGEIDKEKKYPLGVVCCSKCFLLQLHYTVPPVDMFSDYVYATSNTAPLVDHLVEMARSLYEKAKPEVNALVVDIGCNDGSLLMGYKGLPVKRVGVEPSSVSNLAEKRGIKVYNSFFSNILANKIADNEGLAKIITATNVYAHVANQNDFLKGITTLLDPEGIFVIEVPHVLDMIEKRFFDTIYHEHVYYFSLTSLENILNSRGFRIFHVEKYNFGPSGPPIRVYICKSEASFQEETSVSNLRKIELEKGLTKIETYKKFGESIWEIKEKLLIMLTDLKNKGEKIVGYGAPAKGNTILNAFGVDTNLLDCILEKSELKCGLLTPGTHIPVVNEDDFDSKDYNYALLLSWNLIDFFVKKSSFIKKGGKFIVPLPEPYIKP